MEGVGGIVRWAQVGARKAMFEEGRKLYTQEINAAVRGAKAAGATEIVVMDCHGAGLTTVSVKRGLGLRTARLLPPSRARELIEEGARKALGDLGAVKPFDPGKPCEVKVEYKSTEAVRRLRFQSGVELVDDRTIVSRAGDWWTAWKQFFFVVP